MISPLPKPIDPATTRLSARIGQSVRRYFLAGLAALLPFLVTVGMVLWFDGWLRNRLGIQFPGLGLLVTFLVILLVGVFTVHLFGRVVFRTLEVWFLRLPVIRWIYPTVKEFTSFVFSSEPRRTAFQRVVMIEYPRKGIYSLAFITNEWMMASAGEPQAMVTALLPTPPNPFTGPVLFVPEADVKTLDLSVEDAVRLIVSVGVVAQPIRVAARTTP